MTSCTINVEGCTDPSLCPVGGFFDQSVLLGTCIPCEAPAGYYCNAGVVTICPAGYYCPDTAGAVPIACPEGYVCQAGYTEPVECGSLSKCPAGSTTKKPGVGAILILVSMIVVIGLVIWLVRKLRVKRLRRSTNAATKHKEIKSALKGLVQGITGTASSTEPLQGFNEKIRYSNPVSIAFNDLGMTVKSNGAVVLEGVTGEFPAGSLVALMGGSGAGKSTFLNALSNRAPYGNVTGEVSLNGVFGETIGKYPRLVGFVLQDDIMHDDLTVYENLMYSARLRLPPSIPAAQQRAIVEDVIEILDLGRIRDSIVGSPEKRGISGGQKKRVNIGMELVAYPRVLFLDEPTSGLDSAASLQVARCLQRMRSLGITVVTVIHQPRWSVFRCFSHCLLLAKGGRTAYLGPTGLIQGYFEQNGFELPMGENVADWFIDIASGQSVKKNPDGSVVRDFVPERDLPVIWKERGQALLASLAESHTTTTKRALTSEFKAITKEEIMDELKQALNLEVDVQLTVADLSRLCRIKEIELASPSVAEDLYKLLSDSLSGSAVLTTRSLAGIIAKSSNAEHSGSVSRSNSGDIPRRSEKLANRPGPSLLTQVGCLIQRNIAKFDTSELIVKALVAGVGAIIVAFTFRDTIDYSQIPVTTQSPLILFTIISATSFLYVFGDERLVFTRESQTGFSITAYWFAKNIVNIIDVVIVSIFYYTFYFIISQPGYRYGEGFSAFLLMAWYTSGVSHLFSVTLPTASALLLAVLVPAIQMSLLSGVKPTMSSATSFQKFLAYIGCGFYSVADLTIFKVKSLPDNVQSIYPVQAMLTEYSINLDDLARNCFLMLALGVGLRILTLIALLIKVHGWPGRSVCTRSPQNAPVAQAPQATAGVV
jgi:ABC-type multidrug transport system ATPase subunit